MKKRILVTGSSGFIGTNLVAKLAVQNEYEVVATYRNTEPRVIFDNVSYVREDLRDQKACFRVCRDIDIVIMAAAESSGAEVMTNRPLVHLTPNVVMNAQMLEAAYESQVNKFVFISSNTVYPLSHEIMEEEDAGYDFYEKYRVVGWMKRFTEEVCDIYSNHLKAPMDTLVIRPSNLFGPHDKYNRAESKVVASLVRKFLSDSRVEVWGDGKDLKNFLYIDDFVDALIIGLKMDLSGVYNICSNKSVSICDVIDELAEVTKRNKGDVAFNLDAPKMIPVRHMSGTKFKDATGWSPSVDLRSGLQATTDWYRDTFKSVAPEEMGY